MYTITGATGHVGSAAAAELLRRGAPVRTVVRDPARGEAWAARGAEVAVADLGDGAALTAALRGSDGAFVLLPTDETAGDAGHRALADSIAGAVGASGVGHVVVLSSVGADLVEGTGPIRWLHHLERGLRRTGATLSVVRSAHFQEKVEDALPAATTAGVYPVLDDDPDGPVPMVATRDVGELVALSLLAPPQADEVVDLDGPAYSERQVAELLGAALGRHLEVVVVPRDDRVPTLTASGVPEPFAHELVALADAGAQGLLRPRGDRVHRCTTPLEVTLRHVVAAALDPAPAR
jgi:uncharacterized protein YbjT (DUF2867 family)